LKGKDEMKKAIVGTLLGVMATLAFASAAFASSHHPTGIYTQFAECPLNRATITDCIYSSTYGGSVKLGNKTVPIENPVTLQGGFEGAGTHIEFYGAENGDTLSKTPQPVPGGLLGLLNCKEQTNPIIKGLCETALENGLTGVNATVELTGPTKGLTNIGLNTENLIFEEGTALSLPVKIKLENPLLGGNCYIGSDKSPVVIDLTSGTSGALVGDSGVLSFNEPLFTIITVAGSKLVNSTFSAPGVKGCGGLLSLLVDPVVSSVVGLPAGSGKNSATLEANFEDAQPEAVIASE
jgi:hypothetical protein